MRVSGVVLLHAAREAPAHVAVGKLAVLPFESTGDDAEYLGDGITESVTNSLSRIPTLRIVPLSIVVLPDVQP